MPTDDVSFLGCGQLLVVHGSSWESAGFLTIHFHRRRWLSLSKLPLLHEEFRVLKCLVSISMMGVSLVPGFCVLMLCSQRYARSRGKELPPNRSSFCPERKFWNYRGRPAGTRFLVLFHRSSNNPDNLQISTFHFGCLSLTPDPLKFAPYVFQDCVL